MFRDENRNHASSRTSAVAEVEGYYSDLKVGKPLKQVGKGSFVRALMAAVEKPHKAISDSSLVNALKREGIDASNVRTFQLVTYGAYFVMRTEVESGIRDYSLKDPTGVLRYLDDAIARLERDLTKSIISKAGVQLAPSDRSAPNESYSMPPVRSELDLLVYAVVLVGSNMGSRKTGARLKESFQVSERAGAEFFFKYSNPLHFAVAFGKTVMKLSIAIGKDNGKRHKALGKARELMEALKPAYLNAEVR